MSASQVWYVSYGSNMSRRRLGCYIEGGRPPGSAVTYVGARDTTMPEAEMAVTLPGSLYFAGDSPTWGGGVAFYDHDAPGGTPARAYRITIGQFVDLANQEMHRIPDPDDPLEEVLLSGLPGERHQAGPGHYETLVEVGRHEGLPMLTFTAPHGLDAVAHTTPRPAYLAMLAEGLREAHGWDEDRIEDYFASVVRGEDGTTRTPREDGAMHYVDHEPGSWFLVAQRGNLYLDARFSHGAVIDSSVLVLLDEVEREAHRAGGHDYLSALATDIHDSAPHLERSPYHQRDLYRGSDGPALADVVNDAIADHMRTARHRRRTRGHG